MDPLHAVAAVTMLVTAPADAEAERLPILLDAGLAEDAALRDELTLRLPDRPIAIARPGDTAPPEFLWVGAESPAVGAFELQVITSDGRLYRRTVELPADADAARVTAGAVANLVEGIERQSITPDQTEVPVPVLEPPAKPETREVVAESETEPRAREVAAEPDAATRGEPTTPDSPHLHLTFGAALPLGLGPPGLPGIVAAGGSGGAAWAGPRGLLLGGRIRGLGWSADDLSMGRVRVWARAGYVWTRRRWSVEAAGGPTVEPLWTSAVVRAPNGARRSSVPLVGLAASAGPRWRTWGRPGGVSLWVALEVELSGSAEARRDLGVLLVRDSATDRALLRAGGLEVTPTLSLELRLPASRARSARSIPGR